MPLRKKHRVGDYLVRDEITGIVRYRSEVTEQGWNGLIVEKRLAEGRHPQERIQALNDPQGLHLTNASEDLPLGMPVAPIFIGATDIAFPEGPAYHLYDPAIGDMSVGFTFIVR